MKNTPKRTLLLSTVLAFAGGTAEARCRADGMEIMIIYSDDVVPLVKAERPRIKALARELAAGLYLKAARADLELTRVEKAFTMEDIRKIPKELWLENVYDTQSPFFRSEALLHRIMAYEKMAEAADLALKTNSLPGAEMQLLVIGPNTEAVDLNTPQSRDPGYEPTLRFEKMTYQRVLHFEKIQGAPWKPAYTAALEAAEFRIFEPKIAPLYRDFVAALRANADQRPKLLTQVREAANEAARLTRVELDAEESKASPVGEEDPAANERQLQILNYTRQDLLAGALASRTIQLDHAIAYRIDQLKRQLRPKYQKVADAFPQCAKDILYRDIESLKNEMRDFTFELYKKAEQEAAAEAW